MSASLLPNGKQTFIDINGKPLVAGTVSMYAPSTLTPKDTWQDSGQTILNSNPIILDSRGEAIIYGSGVYRQIVKDSLGNTIWDEETSAFGTSVSSAYNFDTTADLLTAFSGAISLPNGTVAITAGRTAVGDGGGVQFYYKSSDTTTADNGGNIRVDSANRRWFANVNTVTPELFGTTGTSDDTAVIQSALNSTLPVVLTKAKYYAAGISIGGTPNLTSNAGTGTVLQIVNGSSNTILTLATATGGGVSNITFDQTGATGSGYGLVLSNCTNVLVRNIGQVAPNNVGVIFSGCVRCSLNGLISSGGGTSGAWVAEFINGNNNIATSISSTNAVNRTLVLENEYSTRVSKISAVNGVSEALLLQDCYNCIGSDIVYTNTNGTSGDDSFAIIGNSYNNIINGVSSYKPAGFGVTISSLASGGPHDNIISGVTVWMPGQQHASINDGGQATGPYSNKITGLIGYNCNQQVAGTFPGFDFSGANNNILEGQIYCDDGKMTYAVVEADNVASSSNNIFRGVAQIGSNGVINLHATSSNTSRVYLEKYSGISFPASTSATFYADVSNKTQIFSAAFAADVTITMATTRAWNGAKFRFVNAGSGGHNLIIKQGVTTLASFAINNFADIQFDGTNWNATALAPT